MRISFLACISLTLLIAVVLHADAQDDSVVEDPAPVGTDIAQQETLDPFLLTATEIIRQATLTATARGTSGAQPTITPSAPVQTITGTPITPIPTFAAQSDDGASEDDNPLILTFVAFGSLLLILIVFGYVFTNASNISEGRTK